MNTPDTKKDIGSGTEAIDQTTTNQDSTENIIPPQYDGLPSEVVEELWNKPVDPENRSETERRQSAIDQIKANENTREEKKKNQLTEQYSQLPDDDKDRFSGAQNDAMKIAHEFIQGERELEGLTKEEEFVLGKIKSAYEAFKEENPDKEFPFELASDIDKKIWDNFNYRLAFDVLNSQKKIVDQEEANKVREEIGIPTRDINDENILMPEQRSDEEIEKIYNSIRGKKKNTLGDELDLVGKGYDPETLQQLDLISGKIGSNFDAHGIAKSNQLESLLNLLNDGIDDKKDFYTAPFEITKEKKAAMGAALGTAGGTAYKDGIAVVTSGYSEKLTEDGIRHVFINDVYGDLIEPLSKSFPQHNFHLLSEQKSVMEKEYEEYLKRNKK